MPGKTSHGDGIQEPVEVICFQGFLKPGISLRALLARGHANYNYFQHLRRPKIFWKVSHLCPSPDQMCCASWRSWKGRKKNGIVFAFGELQLQKKVMRVTCIWGIWICANAGAPFPRLLKFYRNNRRTCMFSSGTSVNPCLPLAGPHCHEWEDPDALSPSPPCTWSTKSSVLIQYSKVQGPYEPLTLEQVLVIYHHQYP